MIILSYNTHTNCLYKVREEQKRNCELQLAFIGPVVCLFVG